MTAARIHPLQIATVLVYLSDVEDGGETSFLLEGKEGLARLATIDYKACDTGIKVRAARLRSSQGCREGQGGAGTAGSNWLQGLRRRLDAGQQKVGELGIPLLAWGTKQGRARSMCPALPLSPVRAGQAQAGRCATVLEHTRERHHRQALTARRLPCGGGHQVGHDQVVSADVWMGCVSLLLLLPPACASLCNLCWTSAAWRLLSGVQPPRCPSAAAGYATSASAAPARARGASILVPAPAVSM